MVSPSFHMCGQEYGVGPPIGTQWAHRHPFSCPPCWAPPPRDRYWVTASVSSSSTSDPAPPVPKSPGKVSTTKRPCPAESRKPMLVESSGGNDRRMTPQAPPLAARTPISRSQRSRCSSVVGSTRYGATMSAWMPWQEPATSTPWRAPRRAPRRTECHLPLNRRTARGSQAPTDPAGRTPATSPGGTAWPRRSWPEPASPHGPGSSAPSRGRTRGRHRGSRAFMRQPGTSVLLRRAPRRRARPASP